MLLTTALNLAKIGRSKGISMKMWLIIALILSLFVTGSVLALAGQFMEALMSGAGIMSILSDLTGGLAG
ncbi:MAG: hypothetical protein ABEK04_02805 [Candidatus Nanohalobium sp.]